MNDIQKISDRIAQQVRDEALRKNREATKTILIQVILAVTGWTKLETWALDAIDRAMDGKPVNITQLKADIEAWKQAQAGGE